MDFLNDKVKPIYFKYLAAAFGSALISSIYSLVDMAMVGKYQGPDGTAALAVVAPIWNIIYSLGLLMGIEGSVLFSTLRGGRQRKYAPVKRVLFRRVSRRSGFGRGCLAASDLLRSGAFDPVRCEGSASAPGPELCSAHQICCPHVSVHKSAVRFPAQRREPGSGHKGGADRRRIQRVWGLLLCFHSGHGHHGCGARHGAGSRLFLSDYGLPLFQQKKYAGICLAGKAAPQAAEDRRNRLSTFFIDIAMGILTVLFNLQILKYLGANALSV